MGRRGHKYNKDGSRGGEGGPLRGRRDDAGRASGQGEAPRAALARDGAAQQVDFKGCLTQGRE